MRRNEAFSLPAEWDEERLGGDLARSIEEFRGARMREPVNAYLREFAAARTTFEALLADTDDLARLADEAAWLLADPRRREAIRYLAGPPISDDDLETLAQASLSRRRVNADPEMARRVVETVLTGIDRCRFPWLGADARRAPTEAERAGAVVASASLVATQRVATSRRNDGRCGQEGRVKAALAASGLREVPTRVIASMEDAPGPGEFCGETLVAGRKADLAVRLWDRRLLPIECKVSNSSTNSIKRLNNDAAAKAVAWRRDLGETQVVPAAVLGGVYKLRNLLEAQRAGLALFWAHDLGTLTAWIELTRPRDEAPSQFLPLGP